MSKTFQIDSNEHINKKITINKNPTEINNKRLVYKNNYL